MATMDQLNSRGQGYLPGLIGIEFTSLEPGRLTSHLTVRPELLAPNGYLHAVVVIALADTTCGYGTFTDLPNGAQRLAERLGFDRNVIYGLGQLYERWDGKGIPRNIKGETIAPAVLVVTLAQDIVLFHRLGGLNASLHTARERRGGAYAPFLVEVFCAHAEESCSGLDREPS
jgi:HD domain